MATCKDCLHYDVCKSYGVIMHNSVKLKMTEEVESKCPYKLFKSKTIKTNADRIRAMSDAELARFLAERCVNESTVQLLDKDNDLTAVQIEALRHRIYCALMQWLKQPAEE